MRASWGGKRPGAGRKRKVIGVIGPAALAPAPLPVPMPPELSAAECAIWLAQAPHAVQAQTLVPRTAVAFRRYVAVAALEQVEARRAPAGPGHRGLLKLLEGYEARFGLVPVDGRPLAAPAVPVAVDPNDAFFATGR